MKKLLVLTAISLLMVGTSISQSCMTDVWMCLQNKQIGKAKKIIEECMPGNEQNAELWLMRGNVYLQRYEDEIERKNNNPKYIIKDTDAIWIANESFFKAVELNPNVEPKPGLIDALTGQILCARPFYIIGQEAKKNKQWEKAYKYLNSAAKSLKLDQQNTNLAQDLGYLYFDLSQIALFLNQPENYKAMLLEATKVKTPVPEIYLLLYDLYKSENDTTRCGEIIASAKKNVPAERVIMIQELELEYYVMTGDLEKLNAATDKLAIEYADSAAFIAKLALYMTNSDQFQKAESYLEKGLAIDSTNFELNQQMGYRYFFEAITYQNLMDKATEDRNWDKLRELKEKEKIVLEKAHTWVEKAYMINNNDRENNIMLQQLKVKLIKEVPQELKDKVDSYKQE